MRRVIDTKGRLFGKLSVIDLAVILLVLIVAVGAYIRFMVVEPATITVHEAPVRYTLEIANVRDWTINSLRVGDRLFASGTPVGTITHIEILPLEVNVVGDTSVWRGVVPDRYVLLVEVSGTATVRDGRYFVSRTVPMDLGNSTSGFSTRYWGFSAMVKEISLYE